MEYREYSPKDQGSVLVVGNLAEYKDASELGCDVLAQPEVVPLI